MLSLNIEQVELTINPSVWLEPGKCCVHLGTKVLEYPRLIPENEFE
jgi:hypothetical protein